MSWWEEEVVRGWVSGSLGAVVSSSSFVDLIISDSVLTLSGSGVLPGGGKCVGRDLDLWR